MSENQLKALLLYRMQQANETFREGEILFNQSAYRGTINRAYYAMFYSVLALLATKKLGTSKHSGAIGLFDREFVKKGLFPRDLSLSLRLAFESRQAHDYGELIEINEQIARKTLNDAKVFISAVESYLRSTDQL